MKVAARLGGVRIAGLRLLAGAARTVDRLRGRPPRIVFLGDSITNFWPDDDPGLFLRGGVNAGVNGDTTAGMLARFDADVAARRPRAVHIMGGTNDLWYGAPGEGAALSIAHIAGMAARARSCGITVILAAPPPISRTAEALFAHAELFPVLRRAILELCRREGLIHVDYAASLCDASGTLVPAYTTDGVHLTRRGYRAMRAQAEQAVAAALEPPTERVQATAEPLYESARGSAGDMGQ